jgi:hypothetical protein
MKFRITESEKNEIRGLYDLNEQGFFNASKLGKKSGEKAIIISKKYEIGFHNNKRGDENVTEKPVSLIFYDGPDNITVDGDTITVRLKKYSGEGENFYTLIYKCSTDTLTREDGYELYKVSYASDDVESLKDKIKSFCNV